MGKTKGKKIFAGLVTFILMLNIMVIPASANLTFTAGFSWNSSSGMQRHGLDLNLRTGERGEFDFSISSSPSRSVTFGLVRTNNLNTFVVNSQVFTTATARGTLTVPANGTYRFAVMNNVANSTANVTGNYTMRFNRINYDAEMIFDQTAVQSVYNGSHAEAQRRLTNIYYDATDVFFTRFNISLNLLRPPVQNDTTLSRTVNGTTCMFTNNQTCNHLGTTICGVTCTIDANNGHHKSAGRLNLRGTVPGRFVIRNVGFELCGIVSGAHDRVLGVGDSLGRNTTQRAQQFDPHHAGTIQHEIGHNFGLPHCNGVGCVMNNGVLNNICSSCAVTIMRNR
jgi:hypothetical protein